MAKIKKEKALIKPCTKCFDPQYLKFNFTYFTEPKNFEDEYRLQMLKRMFELSKPSYIILLNMSKQTGFEFEEFDKLGLRKNIPKEFENRFDASQYAKCTVMRLYTNDNPILARIVGVTINKVFYVFDLYIGSNRGYKH